MENESLKVLKDALRIVLFDYYGFGQLKKANLIVSLCGYYNNDNRSSEVNDELVKLNRNLLNYELLDKLTKSINRLADKDINYSFEPRYHRDEGLQNMNLSPTFNIGNIDFSKIIDEIEILRNEINNHLVNFNVLISYISKRCEETGDLNKILEERK
jgi:hypothetical protein